MSAHAQCPSTITSVYQSTWSFRELDYRKSSLAAGSVVCRDSRRVNEGADSETEIACSDSSAY